MRDDIRPGRPALRAGDRQPVPPAVLPGGGMLSPLDSADASFRALTTGPQPLALHTASLAPGLPDRQVPLDELRALLPLQHRAASFLRVNRRKQPSRRATRYVAGFIRSRP